MNRKLGQTATQEICTAMTGLEGSSAKAVATRLAEQHETSIQHVYRMTKHVRPATRKKRSDAGKRTFKLVDGTDVWTAAQLVLVDKLDPDQALLVCRTRGLTNLPSLEYFRQMLAEHGLGKQQRRTKKVGYRRWEAEYPGELFQIDVTALKVRWRDEKTRRIMQINGVDKNHPMMDETKLRVWQIMLTDDHSRRKFLRYFVARAITSTEMVRFECEAFSELGVPLKLYTDQGGEFKGRHKHAERLINKIQAIAETGGFRHIAHAPYNSKATGKVENAHKWAEKMDRLVGLADTEGQNVTIETLNEFANRVCDYYNNSHVHRVTGQTPMTRWHGKRVTVRTLPRKIIESALLSDEFPARLDESMTVTRNGVSYRIPGQMPFVDFVGKQVQVVIPPDIGWIVVTLPNASGKFEPTNGGVFEVEKVVATADKAGEFKTVAESTGERLMKDLKATRKESVKAIKAQKGLTGEIAPVPHYNIVIEGAESTVRHFPQTERIITPDEIAAVTPTVVTPSYTGKNVGYWQAVAEYSHLFDGGKDDAKQFLLGMFPGSAGELPAGEIVAAIESRHDRRTTGLRAVS